MPTFRTFESFDIRWDRGSTWTNYDTEAEAQAVIAASSGGGHVERKTWEVKLHPGLLERDAYQPGIADRFEAEEGAAR